MKLLGAKCAIRFKRGEKCKVCGRDIGLSILYCAFQISEKYDCYRLISSHDYTFKIFKCYITGFCFSVRLYFFVYAEYVEKLPRLLICRTFFCLQLFASVFKTGVPCSLSVTFLSRTAEQVRFKILYRFAYTQYNTKRIN